MSYKMLTVPLVAVFFLVSCGGSAHFSTYKQNIWYDGQKIEATVRRTYESHTPVIGPPPSVKTEVWFVYNGVRMEGVDRQGQRTETDGVEQAIARALPGANPLWCYNESFCYEGAMRRSEGVAAIAMGIPAAAVLPVEPPATGTEAAESVTEDANTMTADQIDNVSHAMDNLENTGAADIINDIGNITDVTDDVEHITDDLDAVDCSISENFALPECY